MFEAIPTSPVQISERVLKVANLVSRFTQDEVAQLLDLVPALQEVKPVSAQIEDDEIILSTSKWGDEESCQRIPRAD